MTLVRQGADDVGQTYEHQKYRGPGRNAGSLTDLGVILNVQGYDFHGHFRPVFSALQL
ncbi:hypothetical protein [Aminicella lysinilytica]|uniref:hypothetical protein n=1 Tax=Aminicella lysinilytica TaxID=433323 RepID=UPI0018518768|nr:hypothetical protein [Clostridiales bacterium]